jgi:E3 ubiquitin-protein ligase RNF220
MSKRRKVAHEPLTPTRSLPKRYHVCPICSASIPTADIAAHYVHERNQLSACQPSIKRPAAVEALAKIVNRPRSKRTEADLLLNRVRANREARRNSEIVGLEDDQNIQECPLCGLRLIGIGMSASEHMQSCIDLQGELEREREEETWDRYEVAGQIRVRAIGLLEGGIRNIPNAVVHSDDDGPDCIVDVEGDSEAVYGGIQYTEQDLNDPGARPFGKTAGEV